MTYGTTDQVATELGRLPESVTDAEADQWQQWLNRVERAISARFARMGLSLVGQIAEGLLDSATVADVEVSAVARKVRNPDGSTSTTVSVDDGSVTRRREGADNLGDDPLTLTADEWAILLPSAATASGAFSVRPAFEPDCAPSPWVWR